MLYSEKRHRVPVVSEKRAQKNGAFAGVIAIDLYHGSHIYISLQVNTGVIKRNIRVLFNLVW